jgi:hypothetical protein
VTLDLDIYRAAKMLTDEHGTPAYAAGRTQLPLEEGLPSGLQRSQHGAARME